MSGRCISGAWPRKWSWSLAFSILGWNALVYAYVFLLESHGESAERGVITVLSMRIRPETEADRAAVRAVNEAASRHPPRPTLSRLWQGQGPVVGFTVRKVDGKASDTFSFAVFANRARPPEGHGLAPWCRAGLPTKGQSLGDGVAKG